MILWRAPRGSESARTARFPSQAVEDNPLLARLPAARADRVVTVADRVWFLRSVRGRMVLLDQLEQEILPVLRA